ncbi:MAG: DUF835 domain-containing protein [Thermoplasmata archaeon]
MNSRALLLLAVIIIFPYFATNVSAEVTVTNITVTMDRTTFYANNSEATATATLEYNGPKTKLGDVNFTWYRPDGSIANQTTDSAKDDANATSTVMVDTVGTWYVNATYVNQTDQFDNESFEVESAEDVVVITNMKLELNAPFFELSETAIATATLSYSGNASLFEAVNFTWIGPSGTVVGPMSDTPNSTGVASDMWKSDRVGDFFIVYANYTGDEPISRSVSFQVFPRRVNTWHNDSVLTNEFWDVAGEPYGVCSNITVEVGATLTIEPGVTVRFCQDTHMTVNGTLISDGTLDSSVNLTAFGFFPPEGYWDGIIINPTSGNSSSISYSRISYASVGLLISSSSPTVERNVFENMSIAAIQLDNTSLNVEFNVFDNLGKGISASGSHIEMRFNRFTNIKMGLMLQDSNVTLYGDTISNATLFGIHAFNSSLSTSLVNISLSSGTAIRLQSQSSADLESSVIENNWYGIAAYSSVFYVSSSDLILNDNSVRADDAQGNLVNTSIEDSADFDFFLDGGSVVIALNCTFNDSKVQVLAASQLIVKYYLDIQVTDEGTGDPVSNAFVEILDDESTVFTSRTPSSGRISWIPVTDRSFDGSSNSTSHVITVRITKEGFEISDGERIVDMSTSHLEVFLATRIDIMWWETVFDPLFLLILLIVVAVLIAAFIMARRRVKEEEEPAPPKKAVKPSDYILRDGTSYLVAGEKSDLAFKIFSSVTKKGASGLCITRTFPEDVQETYNLEGIPVLWLSRDPKRGNINPTNLGAILLEVERFLKKGKGKETVVMLDGLEYLIVQNDFSKVIKFVQNLRDTISVSGSKLLMPFNLVAIEESKRALLTRDLEVIE